MGVGAGLLPLKAEVEGPWIYFWFWPTGSAWFVCNMLWELGSISEEAEPVSKPNLTPAIVSLEIKLISTLSYLHKNNP